MVASDDRALPQTELEMHRLLRNRVFLGIDIVGWALTPVAALALRLDGFGGLGRYLPHLAAFAAIAAVCKFASLWFFGLYRRYWRYASIDELFLITVAVVTAGVVATGVYFYTLQAAGFQKTRKMVFLK